MSTVATSGAYQDLVPGSVYALSLQVKGATGDPLTGRTVKLILDPIDPAAAAARVTKTITSFQESSYGLAGGLASTELTEGETILMGASPGRWKVLWLVDEEALTPIRELVVTPMPKGDV